MLNDNEKRRRGRPPINDETMVTVSMRVEQKQRAALVTLAARQGVTISDVYRRFLDLGLQQEQQHQAPGA